MPKMKLIKLMHKPLLCYKHLHKGEAFTTGRVNKQDSRNGNDNGKTFVLLSVLLMVL